MPEIATRSVEAETIFAPATGTGRSAVAIVRISGSGAHDALRNLTRRTLPPWRMLSLKTVFDRDGGVLDQALVAAFPAGSSYTGEPMAEIQCHGGPAVLADLLGLLGSLPGFRLAAPGEFTRRALFAGRMDLSEVEGLADLIEAETSGQRRQALRLQSGAISRKAESWRAQLLRARALLEVTIDWTDEEVPEDVGPEACSLLDTVIAGLEWELGRAHQAERMRSGFEVAIVGPPNVGKSSLLNAISGRDAAIVSDVAGTTRDVLEVRFDLGGLAVTFLDTAGIRETSDRVETIGVDRARARARAADLRLLMCSCDVPWHDQASLWQDGDVTVWAKSDLGSGSGDIAISALRDEGVSELLEMVRERLALRAGDGGLLSHVRQRLAVEQAREHLGRCRAILPGGEIELAAEELRLATLALDRLVGRMGVEDVLGEIFAGFCLGK